MSSTEALIRDQQKHIAKLEARIANLESHVEGECRVKFSDGEHSKVYYYTSLEEFKRLKRALSYSEWA